MRVGGPRPPSRAQLRALDLTVSVDHGNNAIVNGQDAGPAAVISGDQPPSALKEWAPWLLGIAALAAVWWLVKDDVDKEGAGVPGPFVG